MDNNLILEFDGKTIIVFAQHKEMIDYVTEAKWFGPDEMNSGCFLKDYAKEDKETVIEMVEEVIADARIRNFCVAVIGVKYDKNRVYKSKHREAVTETKAKDDRKYFRFFGDDGSFITIPFKILKQTPEEMLLRKVDEILISDNKSFKYELIKKEDEESLRLVEVSDGGVQLQVLKDKKFRDVTHAHTFTGMAWDDLVRFDLAGKQYVINTKDSDVPGKVGKIMDLLLSSDESILSKFPMTTFAFTEGYAQRICDRILYFTRISGADPNNTYLYKREP